MLNLLQVLKNVRRRFILLSKPDNAWQDYEATKLWLQAIRQEAWYIQIVQYHELEIQQAMEKLSDYKLSDKELAYWQAKYCSHIDFLTWLETMTA